jgi:hypothetical protein
LEHNENFKTTVVGVSLLFVIITSALSLVDLLLAPIIFKGVMTYNFQSFLLKNILWIITAGAIIIVLTSYAKKLGIQYYSDLIKDTVIRKTTGLLIMLEGLIDLSNTIPASISSITSSTRSAQLIGRKGGEMAARVVTSNILYIAIILLQIFLGIWLIKLYKEKA